jgi:hypothetical protein
MPERVVADDVVPGADARQRRIDDDEPADPRGILSGERIPHYVPDIVGHEVGLVDLEGVQDAGDVVSLGLLVIAPGRPRGESHAAKVRNDHRVPRCQSGGECAPHVARLTVAMQQDHGRPYSTGSDEQGCPIGRDLVRAKAGRKRHHLRGSGGDDDQDSRYHTREHAAPPHPALGVRRRRCRVDWFSVIVVDPLC